MTDVAERPMAGLAEALGVVDGLLFRRVSPQSWAHLGGFGRGRGWAGIVEVDAADKQIISIVPAGIGQVRRFEFVESTRIIGPYYAPSGALVRVGHDVVVVLGNPSGRVHKDVSDDQLRELADLVDHSAEDVSPSKRLGDELEVLHAIRAMITTRSTSLAGTSTHILQVALEALSCELGILRDGDGTITVIAEPGGIDSATFGLDAAIDELSAQADGGTLCLQEVDSQPELLLPRLAPQIRSILCLPIPDPFGGTLVVAHTAAGPRGFTNLCQRLGEQLVDTANVIGHTAALRDDLQVMAEQHRRAARTDPLTGLGNRLHWQESLAAAQLDLENGTAMTVIALDVDGLKSINDTYGHDAGDELLQRCADVLRESCREGDVAVRLGGDEFALLLPVDEGLAARRIATLKSAFDDGTNDQVRVAASIGAVTARRGDQLGDVARAADRAMYSAKRSRTARSTP